MHDRRSAVTPRATQMRGSLKFTRFDRFAGAVSDVKNDQLATEQRHRSIPVGIVAARNDPDARPFFKHAAARRELAQSARRSFEFSAQPIRPPQDYALRGSRRFARGPLRPSGYTATPHLRKRAKASSTCGLRGPLAPRHLFAAPRRSLQVHPALRDKESTRRRSSASRSAAALSWRSWGQSRTASSAFSMSFVMAQI